MKTSILKRRAELILSLILSPLIIIYGFARGIYLQGIKETWSDFTYALSTLPQDIKEIWNDKS